MYAARVYGLRRVEYALLINADVLSDADVCESSESADAPITISG